jgi:hypothetical protein
MIRVPSLEDKDLERFLIELMRELERTDKATLSAITANRSLLLISPNKTPYEVTVTDAGALTTSAPTRSARTA